MATLLSVNSYAAMDCNTESESEKCTKTKAYFSNGGPVNVDFSIWYNSYRANIYYILDNPYPNYMKMGDLQDILESQNDK
ncbi:hypothetical protein [Pseudoalteromonas agarivorans]|uniref:Uncharacterized protein n=1 Tax=Pseudoalteromonas agarivorans TaxID=176102 RepID=A0AAD0XEN8_9GAMM|nr:hypothetical protein [Pseudoalteromonas agarivorans]AYM88540.1 hypothetical protein D9T18_17795 [Pseudoalteromonas agarivorans]